MVYTTFIEDWGMGADDLDLLELKLKTTKQPYLIALDENKISSNHLNFGRFYDLGGIYAFVKSGKDEAKQLELELNKITTGNVIILPYNQEEKYKLFISLVTKILDAEKLNCNSPPSSVQLASSY